MQTAVRQSLTLIAKAAQGEDLPAPPIIDDFGLNGDYNDMLSSWFALREYHILPYAGGWLDQPVAWRDDMHTLEAVYNEIVAILKGEIAVIQTAPKQDDGAEIRLGL